MKTPEYYKERIDAVVGGYFSGKISNDSLVKNVDKLKMLVRGYEETSEDLNKDVSYVLIKHLLGEERTFEVYEKYLEEKYNLEKGELRSLDSKLLEDIL